MNIDRLDEISFILDKNNKISTSKVKKALSDNALDNLIRHTNWMDESSSISERAYVYVNDILSTPLCKTCNKNKTKFSSFVDGYRDYCSNKCAQRNEKVKNKVIESNRIKYGVDYTMKSRDFVERVKSTNIEKYGVHCTLLVDSVKNKIRNVMNEKYGVSSPLQSNIIRDKFENTMIEKYGVKHAAQSNIIKNKLETIMVEKYGVKNYNQRHNPKVFSLLDDSIWLTNKLNRINPNCLSTECGVSISTIHRRARKYNISLNTGSYDEKNVINFVNAIYSRNLITNTRKVIPPLELDIYIPEKKLAIELNGVYWHSTKFRDKDYHLNKTIECEKNGIQLLHIFDFEWNTKSDIWKSVIANKLGVTSNRIYARKCIIKEMSVQDGFKFFEENHLQGGLSKGTHIGLYYQDELVSCISYGASRFKKDEIEIYRFANKLNTNVVGGFSKLLKRIPHSVIVSYANRRWSNGMVYEKNGFELVGKTKPNYFYYKNGEIYSRQKFQKHKLKEMKSYDELKTEGQIMDDEGYLRIYDCGNFKYVYKRNQFL